MLEGVELLRATVSSSGIKRVAVVDDVFDTPTMGEAEHGAFLDFLKNGEDARVIAEIERDLWDAAITDVGNGDHDSGSIAEVLECLYTRYIYSGDSKFDPAKLFSGARDLNLGYLRPLLELLRSCETLEVKTFGSEPVPVEVDQMPDLVFVDLYLNPAMSPVAEPGAAEGGAAIDKSMQRVRHLLNKDPAVILMSSHGANGRREADSYRQRLDDKVYGSRFGFVDKGQVTKDTSNVFKVEGAANDTLLDIFQTYEFGLALSESTTRWLTSTTQAIAEMGKDVRKLQLKEIAYLVQFRLAAEGQGLEEYLEWFFGEALLDYIVRATDAAHIENPLDVALDAAKIAAIDGGFEPTKNVAKMFHRVRVESKRSRARSNFRLGDLYRDLRKNRVVAVMTPDCDLVLRKVGNKLGRNADHILFVPGQISDLENTSASVGDFLMIGEKPHNIQWNYKKVFSAPFEGTLERAGQSGADFEYLGALRPLYAQEVQANLLNHVGRVGVAVPPVIGVPALATIVVRTVANFKEITIKGTTLNCNLIPARASKQNSRVVFDREVIRRICGALVDMPLDDLIQGSAAMIEVIREQNGVQIRNALMLGPELDAENGTKLSNGILLATGKRDESDTAPWCAIYVKPIKEKTVTLKAVDNAKGLEAMPVVETIAVAPAQPPVGLVDSEPSEPPVGLVESEPSDPLVGLVDSESSEPQAGLVESEPSEPPVSLVDAEPSEPQK